MRSTAIPLFLEIWRRGRGSLVALAAASALSWLIDFTERGNPAGPTPTAHNQLLAIVSFAILLAMFSYVESTGDRGMGRFPRRHFTLPVSTLQLVAVPVVAGIAGIELLYVLWMGRLSPRNQADHAFVAILLAAFMVFYQAALWMLERLGPLRLVVLGAIGTAFFWVGSLPSMAESGVWTTKPVLAGIVAGLAALQFLAVWRHVARVRSEAERDASRFGAAIARFADALPRGRVAFRSAGSAAFWFEWRSSGAGFPALVAGVLVLLLGPTSVLIRNNPTGTVEILVGALALPLVLAFPAGLAFSKPMFWSEEMTLPPFMAVRPVADAELIAIKIKTAAVATVIAWLLVLGFLSLWLPLWANQASVTQLIAQLRAMDDDWWFGIPALVVCSAMFVSWRFLVAALWAGMSGKRALFMASFAPIGIVVIASAIVDIRELPRWIAEDLGRLTPFLWGGVVAMVAKFWLAARGLRRTTWRWIRWYAVLWLAGVACLIGLGAVVMRNTGEALAHGDVVRLWAALILLAVLAMPMARVAWAPWFLGRNRHRR